MRIFTKRNFKRLFLAWLTLNLLLLIIYWPLVKQLVRFSPIILPTHYSTPSDLVESQAQDIQHLRKILKYDRSFSETEKIAFIDHMDTMAEYVGNMSDAEFYLNVSEAMALAENGHTNVPVGYAYRNFNRADTEFFWFSDGLYIIRAHTTQADLIGARLIEIEGRTPEDVTTHLARYIGGAPTWKRLQSINFLRSPELMYAAGLSDGPTSLNVKVMDSSGIERVIILKALPVADEEEKHARASLIGLSPKALPR